MLRELQIRFRDGVGMPSDCGATVAQRGRELICFTNPSLPIAQRQLAASVALTAFFAAGEEGPTKGD
jgi:hypothetical protein